MKTLKQVTDAINQKLEDNLLLAPAIGLAEHFVKTYNDEDWDAYEKETGNPRLNYAPPKNGLEAMIDEATGYTEQQKMAAAKFLLWNITEFEKGFNESLDEWKEETLKNNS